MNLLKGGGGHILAAIVPEKNTSNNEEGNLLDFWEGFLHEKGKRKKRSFHY